jgi:hypothetical protein
MRTTVRLNPALLTAAKREAARAGVTLTALLEEGLRLRLAKAGDGRDEPDRPLPTYRGRGLQPGVDLDDSSALTDLMDRADGAP